MESTCAGKNRLSINGTVNTEEERSVSHATKDFPLGSLCRRRLKVFVLHSTVVLANEDKRSRRDRSRLDLNPLKGLNAGGHFGDACCSINSLYIEFMYIFSTERYRIITEKQFYVLKRLSDTRWFCRDEATKTIVDSYSKIKEALTSISCDNLEKMS
ncbi:unnamed protein product [Brassicogethes aeneus]|uniref:Uncharacterized protein n=1 Tax=Brassicogethes aeneus TaxID=1431903 RepID=A0A9P0B702_BRAAE|nr:unnamed protein product [Brassicogethes aeneus]